jgi:type IV pilus assembly protein PilY1
MTNLPRSRLVAAAACLGLAASLALPSIAAETDIATAPLFTTSTTVVKPNVMFVMDNSGSMAWDFMPDEADFSTDNVNSKYGRRASQCNGLAFNPAETAAYKLPVDAAGVSVSAASTAFLGGTVLSAGSVSYLGSGNVYATTSHRKVSSTSSLAVVGSGDVTVTLSSGSADSYYDGMVVSLLPTTTYNGNVYLSSGSYMIGKVAGWDSSTRVLTVAVAMKVGSGPLSNPYVGVGSPIDNVYYTYSGSQTAMNYRYPSNSLDTTSTFYKECNSAIGSDPGKSVFTAHIVTPGSDTAQRYANWYYHYSTRMLMMKTSLTLAFKDLDDKYRVGYAEINADSALPSLDVADFGSTQKNSFYTKVNAANPSGNTPLRSALGRVGRYYAKKLSDQAYDPVQYSCQKNFTILSTDGYWNSTAGVKLDGSSAVGQQDGGATERPMYDGGVQTVKTTKTWTETATGTRTTVTPSTRTDTTTSTTVTTVTTPYTKKTYTTSTRGCTGGSVKITEKIETYNTVAKTTTVTTTEQSTRSITSTIIKNLTRTTPKTQVITVIDGVQQSDVTTSGTVRYTVGSTISGPTVVTGEAVPVSPLPAASSSSANPTTSATQTSTSTGSCVTTAVPASTGGYVAGTATSANSTPVVASSSSTVTGANVVTDNFSSVSDGTVTVTTTSNSVGGTSDTLADVAMYYYQTDLRTSALSNCTGALGNSVCANDVTAIGRDTAAWQHMSTYTLSLGLSGTLQYDANYESQTSGDYRDIVLGDKNWPSPSSNGGAVNIDDLWHAAVNGRGRFFSATDPATLASSLASALNSIQAVLGSSSAAATSTLQPVEGDNGVYIAQFKSSEWTGDLRAYEIDPNTGAVTTSVIDSATGDLTDTATWSASARLSPTTSRTIYYFKSGSGNTGSLRAFTYDNLTADGLNGHFDNACSKTPALVQCSGLSTAAAEAINSGSNMVSFLRGQAQSQYRTRAAVLGDIVNSSPVYVGKPSFQYTENGYASFKSTQAARAPTLYVGANDGMLHAFDASNGTERWAYVPGLVMDKLYKLGDQYYESKHQYYVDATPVAGDVYSGGWKTILVGGLNGGGAGYYALDISNPTAPVALWEFKHSNLGLSYGNPIITKRSDGRWVVVVTSGYNNADGGGHLFVLDAITGALLKQVSTGEGSSGSPSGLGRLNAWVDFDTENLARRFYAGDLLGNVWRFDIDDVLEPHSAAFKLAQLLVDGTPQPITTQLQLAEIEANGSKHAVVYVGTGQYLGASDVSSTARQSIYAIKDSLSATSLGDVRAGARWCGRRW